MFFDLKFICRIRIAYFGFHWKLDFVTDSLIIFRLSEQHYKGLIKEFPHSSKVTNKVITAWEDKVALGLRPKGGAQLQQNSKDLVQQPYHYHRCSEVSIDKQSCIQSSWMLWNVTISRNNFHLNILFIRLNIIFLIAVDEESSKIKSYLIYEYMPQQNCVIEILTETSIWLWIYCITNNYIFPQSGYNHVL